MEASILTGYGIDASQLLATSYTVIRDGLNLPAEHSHRSKIKVTSSAMKHVISDQYISATGH